MNKVVVKILFFIIKVIILITCSLIILNELKDPNYKILNYFENIVIEGLIFLIFLSFLSNFFQLSTNKELIELSIKKKINNFYFCKIYFNSQILNISLPFSGLAYRAYYLKKLTLSYKEFFSLNFYLMSFGIYFSFFLYGILILIIDDTILDYKYIISSFLICSAIIVFYLIRLNKYIVSAFKLLKLKFISNFLNIVFLFKTKLNFYKSNKILIKYTLMIHFVNFTLIYLAINLLSNNQISFEIIIIFFVMNSALDQFPITPKNLGISELVFGYLSTAYGLSFELGIAIKLLIRLLYFSHLYIAVIIFNIINNNKKFKWV